VEYHPELEGEHEPYVARLLDYPELQGYGFTPSHSGDALGAFWRNTWAAP
jgi:hypothetical protein